MVKVKKMVEVEEEVDGVEEEFEVEVEEVVDVEAKLHLDARDVRILAVKNAIEAARLARVAKLEQGIAETEGAKLDREAKEKKDLEEASKLKVIEGFGVENMGNPDFNTVVVKLKEIVEYLNGKSL